MNEEHQVTPSVLVLLFHELIVPNPTAEPLRRCSLQHWDDPGANGRPVLARELVEAAVQVQ